LRAWPVIEGYAAQLRQSPGWERSVGQVARQGGRHSRAERLAGRPVPKKCDDRANYDSKANAVNHCDDNQSLGGIHRLRHFGRPKIHFFLESVPSV
jgi:hypothetical protein